VLITGYVWVVLGNVTSPNFTLLVSDTDAVTSWRGAAVPNASILGTKDEAGATYVLASTVLWSQVGNADAADPDSAALEGEARTTPLIMRAAARISALKQNRRISAMIPSSPSGNSGYRGAPAQGQGIERLVALLP
jgi:hypothetical protein